MTRNVLHVITVGLSVSMSIEYGRCPGLENVLDPRSLAPTPLGGHLADRAVDGRLAVADFPVDPIVLAATRPDTGAEWTSVEIYSAEASNALPSGAHARHHDSMLILSTDTPEGLRTATLVAGRYAAQRGIPIRLAGIEGLPLAMPRTPGEVVLSLIPDLDLSKKDGTLSDDTWTALGRWGKTIADTCRGLQWDVVFHLNGGYKAFVPYFLVMAEGINTVFHQDAVDRALPKSTVRAVTVHESAAKESRHLVDLPVRYLSVVQADRLRRMTAAVARGDRPADGAEELDGQFATYDGDRYRPNHAGKILGALL